LPDGRRGASWQRLLQPDVARGFVITIVGAESTGKTMLAASLQAALASEGREAALVGEYLREFCEREQRTPVVSEQAGIATEQSRRIDVAAGSSDIVIADTTALMIAVYSETVFGDTSLYSSALAAHARCDLTLLTALDIPWQADGHQRDGPHVREPVDAMVRAALQRAKLPYAIVAGTGDKRLAAAMQAVRHALNASSSEDEARANPTWQWVCERCGDVDCERHLLPRFS
jgi:nicotinamide riboside kinase